MPDERAPIHEAMSVGQEVLRVSQRERGTDLSHALLDVLDRAIDARRNEWGERLAEQFDERLEPVARPRAHCVRIARVRGGDERLGPLAILLHAGPWR